MQMVLKARSQREETGEEDESEPPVIIHFKQSVFAWIPTILFSMKPNDVFRFF